MDGESVREEQSSCQSVYEFIVDFISKNGYSPCIREICLGTDIKSTSTIREHLMKLELFGKIRMKDYKSRTISVVGYEFRKID